MLATVTQLAFRYFKLFMVIGMECKIMGGVQTEHERLTVGVGYTQ